MLYLNSIMSRRVWVKRDNHRWKKLKHTQARDYYLLECERAAEDASWWAPFQSEGMSEGVFYGRKLAPYQDILLLRDTSGLSRSNNSASLQFGLISLLWFGHKRFKIWAWVCLYALAYLLQCVCTCVLRRGSVSCPLVCFSRLASSSFWRANPPPLRERVPWPFLKHICSSAMFRFFVRTGMRLWLGNNWGQAPLAE